MQKSIVLATNFEIYIILKFIFFNYKRNKKVKKFNNKILNIFVFYLKNNCVKYLKRFDLKFPNY